MGGWQQRPVLIFAANCPLPTLTNLAAIFPAMLNALIALKALGYPDDHPQVVRAEKKLKELNEDPLSVEGAQSGEWILVDFGEVLVHIMQPAVRAYYNLEELWNAHPKAHAKTAK